MEKNLPSISSVLKKWLLIGTLAAFLFITACSLLILYFKSVSDTERLLRLTILDVSNVIQKTSKDALNDITGRIASAVRASDESVDLKELQSLFKVSEINIYDENGIIVRSTDERLVGYDIHDHEQFSEFLEKSDDAALPWGWTEHIGPNSDDSSIIYRYTGAVFMTGGFIQVGFDQEQFDFNNFLHIYNITDNRHVMDTGQVIIEDPDYGIISQNADYLKAELLNNELKAKYANGAETNTLQRTAINGVPLFWMYDTLEDYKIIAAVPVAEAMESLKSSMLLSIIMAFLVSLILNFGISYVVNRVVVKQVSETADKLAKITEGDLDTELSVRETREFDQISDSVNATVASLKELIVREAERNREELRYASDIQRAALPSLTETFTANPNFRLYADMNTAKEVGGDFFDFYMLDDHKLAFLVADVSGKGIPASLFMMTGKTTLRDCAEKSDNIGEILSSANHRLCERNDMLLFITAWMGILDFETGLVDFVNAGHNPPVLIRDGKPVFLKLKRGPILGYMDGIPYAAQTLQLQQGDVLYLYTDGVTEAANIDQELYGEKRLLNVLCEPVTGDGNVSEEICRKVTESVNAFVCDAPQADDITMVCLKYLGMDKNL